MPIDTTIATGDPAHVQHHIDLANGVNTLTATAGPGNIKRWIEGVNTTPSLPIPAGTYYEVIMLTSALPPSWVRQYDTVLRPGAAVGGDSVPVTVTQLAHFESTASVTTSGAISLGSIPVGTPILVLVGAGATAPGLAVTNTNGNTWTSIGSNTVTSIASTVAAYRTTTTSATADSVTVTRSPSGGLSVAVYALDGTTGAIGNGGTVPTGSSETNVTSATSAAVTVLKDSLAVFVVATGNDVLAVSPQGASDTASQFSATGTGNPRTLAIGFDNAVAAGSSTPGISWTNPRAWAGITLVFDAS